MSSFLDQYWQTKGPIDVPMLDEQAYRLEKLMKDHKLEPSSYERAQLKDAVTDLVTEQETSDVSWISTEDVDRGRDVVLSRGMDKSHFDLNPLVPLNHNYWMPPIGKSAWVRQSTEANRVGIKAKTVYPSRPGDWDEATNGPWEPSVAFSLVRSGLLNGKSIGFLPLQQRSPTEDEKELNPQLRDVRRIVEKWLLIEYSCVYVPMQQHAVVESVSKHVPFSMLNALGISQAQLSFDLEGTIERAFERFFQSL